MVKAISTAGRNEEASDEDFLMFGSRDNSPASTAHLHNLSS